MAAYWTPGSDSDEPTHVILQVRAIRYKGKSQVTDETHPDAAKIRTETDDDRECRDVMIKFFQFRGARDLCTDDLEWCWDVDCHPACNPVRRFWADRKLAGKFTLPHRPYVRCFYVATVREIPVTNLRHASELNVASLS